MTATATLGRTPTAAETIAYLDMLGDAECIAEHLSRFPGRGSWCPVEAYVFAQSGERITVGQATWSAPGRPSAELPTAVADYVYLIDSLDQGVPA